MRKQSFGVCVERMFPLHSPKIDRIEVAARGDVRRAKLYYLRDRVGKRARVRERRYTGPEEAVQPGLLHEPEQATDADGVTADEAVLDATVEQPLADGAGEAGSQEHAEQVADAAEPAAETDSEAQPEAVVASAAESSADAGGADEGAPAGDQPA